MPTRREVTTGLAASLTALSTPAILSKPARAVGVDAMIGEMLVIGLTGNTADAQSSQRVARQIEAGLVGGVVMLRHNIQTRAGTEGMTRLFLSAGRSYAPFTMVDQEGGAVQRLSRSLGYTDIPRAREVAQRMTPDQARDLYLTMAREAKAAGFNFNLAPVVDLDLDTNNPVVGKWGRSWGRDATTVIAYATAFLDAHRQAGIACSIKHFPGHGTSRGDSHDGFVDISATWQQEELTPFVSLVRSGEAQSVMTAHLYHSQLSDDGHHPVTLSPLAIDGFLRSRVGFDGVVITDDLDMGAIRQNYTLEDAVVLSIAAGNDLIMLSNSADPDPELPQRMIARVNEALSRGTIRLTQVERAVERIRALKQTI
ncbi:MAG: glycoside hydrolase family 3 N-terminal domain-containing protein [Pseudomonadota bacterium]